MSTVKIPPVLRPSTGGEREVAAEGGNVGDVLRSLAEQHPATQRQLFGEDGSLNRYVNVYLNDEDVRVLEGLGHAGRRARHARDPAGDGRRLDLPRPAETNEPRVRAHARRLGGGGSGLRRGWTRRRSDRPARAVAARRTGGRLGGGPRPRWGDRAAAGSDRRVARGRRRHPGSVDRAELARFPRRRVVDRARAGGGDAGVERRGRASGSRGSPASTGRPQRSGCSRERRRPWSPWATR